MLETYLDQKDGVTHNVHSDWTEERPWHLFLFLVSIFPLMICICNGQRRRWFGWRWLKHRAFDALILGQAHVSRPRAQQSLGTLDDCDDSEEKSVCQGPGVVHDFLQVQILVRAGFLLSLYYHSFGLINWVYRD